MPPTAPALSPDTAAILRVLDQYRGGRTAAMGVSSAASLGDSNASSRIFIGEPILAEQSPLSSPHTATRPFHSLPQVSAHDG